jgi:carboxypeptidase Taq
MSQEAIKKVFTHYKKITGLESINSVLYWDFETMMPKSSGGLRSDQLSLLGTTIHALCTDKTYVDAVMSLDENSIDSSTDRKHLKKLKKSLAKDQCLDDSYIERSTQASLRTHEKWKEARETKSFSVVKNELAELVSLKQEYAQRISSSETLKPYFVEKNSYEILLDEFEPGISAKYLRETLKSLVDQTVALLPEIQEVQSSQKEPTAIKLNTDAQHQLVLKTAAALGFDFNHGRIDKSVHPFCSGHPLDTRMTTRYREEDATDSIWSTIHETGHALYEQGLPKDLVGLPCGTAASMGVHESQSRFYENQIAKSLPFCSWIAPELGVSADELYRLLNRVQKSFVRVDADEVTYNLHIYLRMELEEKLILGTLAVDDLEDAWNELFYKTFGLKPSSALEGVLQDTHWYGGMFGYFPTYSLGNLLAAELFTKYQDEFPNWSELVSKGSFSHIKEFMSTKVHSLASLDDSPTTMTKIIGDRLPQADTLINHFKQKYL